MLRTVKKLIVLFREDSIRKTAHAVGLLLLATFLIWITYSMLLKSNVKDLDEALIDDASAYQSKYTADQTSFDPEILEANRKAWNIRRKGPDTRFRDFVYSIFFHPALVFFVAIIVNIIFIGSIVVYYITKRNANE
jgi:cbb3-type cytochrome oxidase subunit 3